MASKSGKRKSQHFEIKSGVNQNLSNSPNPIVASFGGSPARQDDKVGVNLRYFQKSYECFSIWGKDELKAFSNWVIKMAQRTPEQITSNTNTCHSHLGKKTNPSLPDAINPDVGLYSLDVGKKGRVHGFFFNRAFFLVWLDREHKILK